MDVDVRLAGGQVPAMRIDLDDLATVRVRARRGLHRSFQLLVWRTYTAVVSGSAVGTDAAGRALRRLDADEVDALGLLIEHCPGVFLNSLFPPDRDFSDIPEYMSYLRAVPPAEVVAELENAFPAGLPAAWNRAVDRPTRWLADLVGVLAALSAPLTPLLHRGRVLIDREIDRMGSAVVRGALDGFLSELGPEFAYHEQSIYFGPNRPAASTGLDGRTLSLAPHIGERHRWAVEADDPHEISIAYPVPDFTAIGQTGGTTARRDGLTQLLGPRRAAILRAAGRPVGMSELAALVGCTPTATSYHCNQMVAADLLQRVRRGQFVLVARSDRGRALFDLVH